MIISYLLLTTSVIPGCSDEFNNKIDEETKASNSDKIEQNPAQTSNPWIKICPIATPRSGAVIAEYNGSFYIYGGEEYSGFRKDLWRYNIASEEFEILTSNDLKAYATMTAAGENLFVFGGYNNDGSDIFYDTLKYFNTSSSSWSDVLNTEGSAPEGRCNHTAVYYNNKIYYYGGYNSTSGILSGTVYELDPFNSPKPKWSENKATGPTRRTHAAAIIGDNMYIFGGTGSNINLSAMITVSLKNELWKYNITNDTWTLISTMPSANGAREGMCMVALGETLYIYGGKTDTLYLNDLWTYSPGKDTWKQLSDGPGARSSFSYILYNGKIYIFGGYYSGNNGQKVYDSDLWMYDPELDSLK